MEVFLECMSLPPCALPNPEKVHNHWTTAGIKALYLISSENLCPVILQEESLISYGENIQFSFITVYEDAVLQGRAYICSLRI